MQIYDSDHDRLRRGKEGRVVVYRYGRPQQFWCLVKIAKLRTMGDPRDQVFP